MNEHIKDTTTRPASNLTGETLADASNDARAEKLTARQLRERRALQQYNSVPNLSRSELEIFTRALLNERDRLLDMVDDYEAGADATPVPEGAAGTTGQLWHKMLQADEAGRFRLLGWFTEVADRSSACFTENHRGRLEHLQFELEDVQAKLSTTLGFDTPQSLHSLTVAVQALRNVLVDGLAARAEYAGSVTLDDLMPKFPAAPSVQEKIGEQLKAAGIDTSAVCGYTWEGEQTDACDAGVHQCRLINPLHVQSHQCDPDHCGQELSHFEAERLVREANQ